jgi:hypothetical protein
LFNRTQDSTTLLTRDQESGPRSLFSLRTLPQ